MTAVRLAVTAHRLAKHGHRSEIHDSRLLPALDRQPEWMAYGLCAQVDGDMFYPEKGGSTREAKAVCRGCPVRSECLEYALDHNETQGVWGGTSGKERIALMRARKVNAA